MLENLPWGTQAHEDFMQDISRCTLARFQQLMSYEGKQRFEEHTRALNLLGKVKR